MATPFHPSRVPNENLEPVMQVTRINHLRPHLIKHLHVSSSWFCTPHPFSPGVNTYFRAGALELEGGVPLKYLTFASKLPRTRRFSAFP